MTAKRCIGARRLVNAGGKWERNDSCLTRLKLEPLQTVIARRKAMWIGHQARRQDRDPGAREFLDARAESGEKWWNMTKQQFASGGTTVERVLDLQKEPAAIRKLLSGVGPLTA